LALVVANTAEAQRPWVTPKYVRTPYVEVYRDPFGGKHIRTPFVEIHKPGFRVPRGYLGPPLGNGTDGVIYNDDPVHTAYREPIPEEVRVRNQLYAASQELAQSLRRFSTGNTWLHYFSLTPGGLLAPQRPQTASIRLTSELVTLLEKFEAIRQDPQYSTIAALPSFIRTHELLQTYIAELPENAAPATEKKGEELPPPLPDEI
jgi:hypothetical protein